MMLNGVLKRPLDVLSNLYNAGFCLFYWEPAMAAKAALEMGWGPEQQDA